MGNASPSVNGKTQYTNKYSIIYMYTLSGLILGCITLPSEHHRANLLSDQ